MIEGREIRLLIIRPTLQYLGLHSFNAEQLVFCTGLAESGYTDIDQDEKGPLKPGPALGLWQMEKATHNDHFGWLATTDSASIRPLSVRVRSLLGQWPEPWLQLAGNLHYAAAMCRIHYFRRPQALPDGNDLSALGAYWKQWYNTSAGKGTVEEFVKRCEKNWKEGL